MSQSKLKNKTYKSDPTDQKETPKIIFVGENKFQLKRIQKFAKDSKLEFHSYSNGEWATLEEIDQYIQEEDLSKQILSLPSGANTVSSLDEMEAETIKKVIKKFDGNIVKAAQTLKIARATLYRKMEKHGLNLKKKREEHFKQQEKILKNVA